MSKTVWCKNKYHIDMTMCMFGNAVGSPKHSLANATHPLLLHWAVWWLGTRAEEKGTTNQTYSVCLDAS